MSLPAKTQGADVVHLPVAIQPTSAGLIESAYSIESMIQQVAVIQSMMGRLMKPDEHFGVIPGTKKPTLYKAGAEKINMAFRLAPTYRTVEKIFSSDLIYYQIECTLTHMPSGNVIATGLGSCNSRETKYKFRLVEADKKPSKEEADRLKAIGAGKWKKLDKGGYIWQERIENDNPYELDNTLLKMACKRALVAATLNATAASDIFTQDLEDTEHNEQSPTPETPPEPAQPEKPRAYDEEIASFVEGFNGCQSMQQFMDYTKQFVEYRDRHALTTSQFTSVRNAKDSCEKRLQEAPPEPAPATQPTPPAHAKPVNLPDFPEGLSDRGNDLATQLASEFQMALNIPELIKTLNGGWLQKRMTKLESSDEAVAVNDYYQSLCEAYLKN